MEWVVSSLVLIGILGAFALIIHGYEHMSDNRRRVIREIIATGILLLFATFSVLFVFVYLVVIIHDIIY